VKIEHKAAVNCAGDAAQKKFNPHRRRGDRNDRKEAINLLSRISGPGDVLSHRFAIAQIEARNLVNTCWKEIQAVAAALLEHKTLTPERFDVCMNASSVFWHWRANLLIHDFRP
jgi:hypothetical protein